MKFIFAVVGITSLIIILSIVHDQGYTKGYRAGHKAGFNTGYSASWKPGFDTGYSTAMNTAQILHESGSFSQSSYAACSPVPGITGDPEWITLSRTATSCTISWQFSFYSHKSGSAYPICRFYDDAGFLIHEAYSSPLPAAVISDAQYQFSGHAIIEPATAARIVRAIPSVEIYSF